MSWPTPKAASPTVILIGTGSEVALCVEAYETLEAGGHRGARGQHAVVGIVRAAGSGLSRQRAAARRHGARVGRGGLGDRLGSLCRHERRQDRHAQLRRVGADQGSDDEIRLHAGEGARRGQGADCASQGGRQHESAEAARSMRPVALAGLSQAQPDREGRVAHADRARRAEGHHLEPVDLREGDRRERRIRRMR